MKYLICRHAEMFVATIISMSLLGFLIVGNHALKHIDDRLIAGGGEALVQTARQMGDALDAEVLKGRLALRIIADAFDAHGATAATGSVETLRAAFPAIRWIAVMDASGRIV